MFRLSYIATGSKGNCCHLSDGKTNLIIDLGIPINDFINGMEYFDEKISDVSGILITHEHGDHISGALKAIKKYAIPCYISKGTFDNSNLFTLNAYLVKQIEHGKRLKIGTIEIMPFQVEHDATEPMAFLFRNELGETLVFVADCAFYSFEIEADFYAIELNYMNEVVEGRFANKDIHNTLYKRVKGDYGHIEMNQAIEFAQQNPVAQYVFHHLSETNIDLERLFKILYDEGLDYGIATNGTRFEFGEIEPY